MDITDLTRNFTKDEWIKLSPEVMQQIKDAREAAKQAGKKRHVAAVAANPAEDNGPEHNEEGQGDNMASNGNSFGAGAYKKQIGKKVQFSN